MELLVIFEVNLMEGRACNLLKLGKSGNEPLLAATEVVNNLLFLFHVQVVIFGRFLYNFA